MCYLRVFLLLLCAAFTRSINLTAVVNTTSGPIVGKIEPLATGHTVKKYLGIPFAKAERFENPQFPTPWVEIKEMVQSGKICPQVANPILGLTTELMSEDCLVLDIYAPNITNSSIPVMVFIHGGSYSFGGSRFYDGSALASVGNVIVVIAQYRLGMFGYLYNGNKGNFGMLDQIMALKWVQNNIKSFGGNPQQVTIFGQSAGGGCVSLLMLSPLTNGLFKNVIIQSGSAVAHWAAAYKKEGEEIGRSIAQSMSCPAGEDVIKCLKTRPSSELVAESFRVIVIGISSGKPGLVPVVDGYFLTDKPVSVLKQGNFTKVNVMIGVTNQEGVVLSDAVPGLTAGLSVTSGVQRDAFLVEARRLSLIRDLTPALQESILYRYTDWLNVNSPVSNRDMYIDMVGDAMFTAPAVHSADAFVKQGMKTFLYFWEHRLPNYPGSNVTMPDWLKAYHGADAFMMLTADVTQSILGPDGGLMTDVMKMWTAFARDGKPDAGLAKVTWPEYTAATRQYLSIKPNFTVKSKLRAEHMAFWNDYMPAAISVTPTTAPPTTTPMTTPHTSGQHPVIRTGYLFVGLVLFASMIFVMEDV
ncbi:acetylcholinesterase [Nematostella vectensis]|uniref:acetylcholinesterase n=1 Tax=Nematostella vectensis TaxID=45351 RepID=UPI00207786F8|nr:acetylcholinesterase [Nematostella vectensis]